MLNRFLVQIEFFRVQCQSKRTEDHDIYRVRFTLTRIRINLATLPKETLTRPEYVY